jgi:hypothetical protein
MVFISASNWRSLYEIKGKLSIQWLTWHSMASPISLENTGNAPTLNYTYIIFASKSDETTLA